MTELSTLGATIKTAYEGQPNTNAFTNAYKALLDSPASGAVTVQDEGAALVARSILNFVGAGVSVADDGLRSVITIPGGATSSGTVRASTGVAAQTPYTHSVDTPILDLISGGLVPATAFGIYPNSGLDETVRIQNALLDLANEGSSTVFGRKRALYFQNGVYLTAGINTTTSTAIVGDGGAVFQYAGVHGPNTFVLKITIPGGGARITYGIARGIKINGLSAAGELAETGIWCATATDWSTLLSQVHIVNCGLYGVRVVGVTNLLVSDFRCDAVGRSAIKIEQPDLRQDLIAINGGTVTWNTPAALAAWASQGYIAAGSVGGAVAYWGAAVLELAHPGGNGGGCFAAVRDIAVEWHLDGDPTGHGVILDRNAGNLKPNRLHLSNIRGFSDSTTAGHQIVGFNGTNGNQPQVTAFNTCLDGTLARSVRDFLAGVNYGNSYTNSFHWAPGRFFSENGSTMAGPASARPAANQYINGYSYFATDTLALSYVVNGAWATVAGGSGGGTALIVQDEGTPLGTQPALNFVGAGVAVVADAANNRNIVQISGSTVDSGLLVQQFGSDIATHPTLNFFGNISVADDPVNNRTNVGILSAEPAAAGNLAPAAIVITAEVMPYNPVVQNGPLTFALDLANSTYNYGSAVFNLTSDGSAITWNANLAFGPTGSNADLATSFAVGTRQIIVTFDEGAGKGLVYYGSSTDATKMPLAGGTFTGAVHLGTGASIISDVRNVASGLDLKDHALAFFDAGNVSGAVSLNYRNGTWQQMTAVGDITSITITNAPATGRLARMWIEIHQDSVGNRLVTFGSAFYYPGGVAFVASAGSNKIDVFDIATTNGGASWLGLTAYYSFTTAPYAPIGVVFDGNDYLLKSSGLAGATNTTNFTFAFWMRLNGTVGPQGIFSIEQVSTPGYPALNIYRYSDNRLVIQGYNGTTLNLDFNTSPLPVGNVVLVMGSFGATQHYLYVNDASDLNVATHNNVARTLVSAPVAIGTNVSAPGNPYNYVGELSDFWFDLRLVDLSNAANRRKFTDSTNHMLYKGPNGELPFGTPPLVFCSGAASAWHLNRGTGGPFTLTGALGISSPAPIGA